MCFRPAEAGGDEAIACTNCGKTINRVAGELPSKCPFCKTSTEGMEDAIASGAPAPAAPAAPGAPAAPKAPAPGAGGPKVPTIGGGRPAAPKPAAPGAGGPKMPTVMKRPGQN